MFWQHSRELRDGSSTLRLISLSTVSSIVASRVAIARRRRHHDSIEALQVAASISAANAEDLIASSGMLPRALTYVPETKTRWGHHGRAPENEGQQGGRESNPKAMEREREARCEALGRDECTLGPRKLRDIPKSCAAPVSRRSYYNKLATSHACLVMMETARGWSHFWCPGRRVLPLSASARSRVVMHIKMRTPSWDAGPSKPSNES